MNGVRRVVRSAAAVVAVAGGVASGADARASAPPSSPPPPSQPTVGGNGLGLVPAGEPGAVSLVGVGAWSGSQIPYVVRNNTDAPVSDVVVSVVVRSAAGELVGLVETQSNHETKPTTLQPGDVGIGMAFASIELPTDAVFEYTVEHANGPDEMSVDLEIVESSWQTDHLIAIVHNPTDHELGDAYMGVLCLSPDGTPMGYEPFGLDGPIAPQSDAIFQADSFWVVEDCSTNLVAGYSY